jgi:prepilin signal peptidase PulO-like enzyme (type II secretory pathway)
MFEEIIIFTFGLAVGSFLNAVIWRLEKRKSVIFNSDGVANESSYSDGVANESSRRRGLSPAIPINSSHSSDGVANESSRRHSDGVANESSRRRGTINVFTRSQCPCCRHKLAWYDLVPILSFLWLGGKCRHCKKRISYQYPAVEIATGALFIAIFNFKFLIFNQFLIPEFLNGHWSLVIGHFINIVFWLYITSALIVIFVYDLKHYIIPDKILFPAIAISIMYHVLSIMQAENYALYIIHNTLYYVGSAIGASAFFLLLVLISRGRAMGLGDVKLAFLMGLILGWPNILVALFSAFFFGALVGLVLIFGGRKTLKSKIPFGPFLIAGTFIALFWGNWLVDWYLRLLL